MPASLTHLLVGRSVLPLLSPEEPGQYYLGCVAPDAPNLDGFAPKEVRWSAHLRDGETDRWVENAARFVSGCAPGERSLALGYAVHVVGDAVWDEQFEKGLRKAIGAKALSREESFRRRWDEHYRFEREQLEADWWRLEVRPLLSGAEAAGVNGLPAGLVRRYLAYLLEAYAPCPEGEPVGYLTEALAAEFGGRVAERIERAGIR